MLPGRRPRSAARRLPEGLSHLQPSCGQRPRQLCGEGRLAHAALAGKHQNDVLDGCQAGGDGREVWVGPLGRRRAGRLVGAALASGRLACLLGVGARAVCGRGERGVLGGRRAAGGGGAVAAGSAGQLRSMQRCCAIPDTAHARGRPLARRPCFLEGPGVAGGCCRRVGCREEHQCRLRTWANLETMCPQEIEAEHVRRETMNEP